MLGMIPSSGNNTSGNRAVTASEVPSPTHHTAIKDATANMRCPLSLMPSASGMSNIEQNKARPINKTTICFLKDVSTQGY